VIFLLLLCSITAMLQSICNNKVPKGDKKKLAFVNEGNDDGALGIMLCREEE
jgi:hypothetical protein